ncbi:MAG: hypothetical protein QOF51_1972 [Chloroflexota bacterium]|jgi:YbbR domain-containing protein|nr:hypothetical protein [Chloroflexota bacterium]
MTALLAHLDLGRAFIAIIISLALYGLVQNEQNPPESGSFDVPVDIVNVPPGLVLVGAPSNTVVQVRVSAPRESWVSLRSTSLRAQIDLSHGTPNVLDYPVAVQTADPQVRVQEIIPPEIPIQLDENIDRSVPLRLNRTGNPPFGYAAGDPQVDPITVTVTGPATVVRRVDSVVVDIRLDSVTVDIDGGYTGTPVDTQGQPVTTSDGRPLRVNPPSVHVHVPISQQLSYKTVGVQPTISGTVASGYVIDGVSTDPSAIAIVGSPQALASINAAATERVDVTDATSDVIRQVDVLVPDGVSVVDQTPVRISVRVSPLALTQPVSIVPSVEDLGPNLQVVNQEPSVQVVLQGPATALRNIRPSDLRATVSAAGLGAGTYQLQVSVSAPSGLTIQSINPRVVPVTIADVNSPVPTVPAATPLPATLLPTAAPLPTARPTATAEPTPTSTPVPPTPTSAPTLAPTTTRPAG